MTPTLLSLPYKDFVIWPPPPLRLVSTTHAHTTLCSEVSTFRIYPDAYRLSLSLLSLLLRLKHHYFISHLDYCNSSWASVLALSKYSRNRTSIYKILWKCRSAPSPFCSIFWNGMALHPTLNQNPSPSNDQQSLIWNSFPLPPPCLQLRLQSLQPHWSYT